MCNCISKREEQSGPSHVALSQATQSSIPIPAKDRLTGDHAPRFRIEFVYSGATSLTAFGPTTQSRYRFVGSGSRVWVDARDAKALSEIPKLRRVR